MKAILVFDVQMTEDGKHICDSCLVWDEKRCMCKYDFMFGHKGCPLKPLPEKNTWDITKNGHVTEYAEGYNACIEELESD